MDRSTLAQQALQHWTKWLPQKVQALKERGELQEAIQGAASQAQRAASELIAQGYQEHEALEVVLPQFVLLPPEAEAKLAPWERKELAQKETAYQNNR
jgi:hypothetical protein